MSCSLRLGFMPTRRRFFSREDSIKYKGLTLAKIRELAPDVCIVDLESLNDEGLIRTVEEGERAADLFISKGIDGIFCPHCNFGTEDAVSLAAKKVGKPVLLWDRGMKLPLREGNASGILNVVYLRLRKS